MLQPTSRALLLPPSGIRQFMHKAYGRPAVISLAAGEPNFPTPRHISEAAHQGALAGFTTYAPAAGLPPLRNLIAERVRRTTGLEATADWITVAAGGVQALFVTFAAMAGKGDQILLPDPGWPNWEIAARLLEIEPVHYRLNANNGFMPDPGEIAALASPRTKALVINSPNNPTGAVYSRELLGELAAVARRHDLTIISDEVYDEIVFEGEHVSMARLAPERTVVVSSFSKTYAMTGWRLGYIVAPPELSAVLVKLQEAQVSSVCSIAQKAGEAALSGPQGCVASMRDAYRARRDAVVAQLQSAGHRVHVPQGAFYIMLNIAAAGLDSLSFALQLLEQKNVAVAPGAAFGMNAPDFVRLSLATDEQLLREAVTRLIAFIDERSP